MRQYPSSSSAPPARRDEHRTSGMILPRVAEPKQMDILHSALSTPQLNSCRKPASCGRVRLGFGAGGGCRLDRCFLELMQDGEEAFLNFRRVVESANVIMATYADELLGDTAVRSPCAVYASRLHRGYFFCFLGAAAQSCADGAELKEMGS